MSLISPSSHPAAATSAPLLVSDPTASIFGTSSPRAVAMDNAGNAAAVWMSPDANGDGGVTMNYAYYANGALSSPGATPTFEGTVASGVVASSTGNWVGFPPVIEVAMAPTSGKFVILWETSAAAHSTTTFTTHVQVFDAAAAQPATAAITVGSGSNFASSVAMNDNGFDVLYDKVSSKGASLTQTVQRYSSAAAAEGSPISIAPVDLAFFHGTGTASISMDDNNDFVVVWTSSSANGSNINAQRYDSATQLLGNVILVDNPNVTYGDSNSSVTMDPVTGDFVVAWQQTEGGPKSIQAGNDGLSELFARQFEFDASGALVPEAAITVATSTFDTGAWLTDSSKLFAVSSGNPASDVIGVAALPGLAGAFELTWTNSYATVAPDSTTLTGWRETQHGDIYAKSYAANGAQTQWLAVTRDGYSGASSAAVDSNGDLLALWSDASQGPVQLDAQLYQQTTQSAINIVPSASSVSAGESVTFTVTATNPDGTTNTGYNGTFNLASSAASVSTDPSNPTLPGLPATVTLAKGVGTFTVALETAGQQTLTATSPDGSITASATVNVAPAALAYFAVNSPSSANAGTPIAVTVTALDAYGNVDTSYSGPIDLASSDSTATFSPVTWINGVGALTVTFNVTSSTQTVVTETITAADPTTGISGTSGGISVSVASTSTSGGGGKKH
jgi:hypothetical protein